MMQLFMPVAALLAGSLIVLAWSLAGPRTNAHEGGLDWMLKHVIVAAAIAGTCLTAEAQDVKAAREACMADYKKHCAGVMPGGGRVKKCLTDNLDKLAPACKAAVIANAGAQPKGR